MRNKIMNERKILQFPIKKVAKKEPSKEKVETETKAANYLDREKFIEALKFFVEFAKSDPRSFSPKNVENMRRVVSGYTNEELYEWVNNFDKNNPRVTTNPSFFHAILQELRDRKLTKKDE